ncbi:hypothetical protein DLJ49_16575 [Rhodovulum sp. 12E13]|uniref:hypothetical protein n=1 Tax=Rhodovulum sp. 12E13 TaxID=2203891 RepID=UPI000E1ADEB6|nr:hypothetical protein [Rhodovulum sp. 12E13]RDC71016.1 hypothetical protein DLJ49_16575 [Rhodovulum sp. 12E13]
MRQLCAILVAGLATPPLATPALAEAPAPALGLELNTVTEAEGACRLTFLAENALGADLDALVLEAVLFTTQGTVDRLTLFDFGALPAGRPRVRQFDVDGMSCDALGQVLVNGATECAGTGLAPGACIEALRLSSRTGVEVAG